MGRKEETDMIFQGILVLVLIILVVFIVVNGFRFLKTCIHNIKTMDDSLFCKIDDLKFPNASRNYEIVICGIKNMYKENGLLDQHLRTMNNSEAIDYLWSRKVYLDDITGLMDGALFDLKAILSGVLASFLIVISENVNNRANIITNVIGIIVFIVSAAVMMLYQYYYRGKHKLYVEVTEEYEKKLLNKKMEALIGKIEMEEKLFNAYSLRQWTCNSLYKKRYKSRRKRKALKELQKMSFFEKDVRDIEFTEYKSKDTEIVLPNKLDDGGNEVELPDRVQRLLELAKGEL